MNQQARLTIDLRALAANWRMLSERAGAAECSAVVKADAYGTGVPTSVAALADAGCRTFFTAHLEEGRHARAAAPQARVFVLNGVLPEAMDAMREAGLRPVLGSLRQVEDWRRTGGGPCAVQVDTGMNRLGLTMNEAACIDESALVALGCEVLISHFVSAEDHGEAINAVQIERFASLAARFPNIAASLANSSGLFLPQKPLHHLCRPGYALYGGNPLLGAPNPMRPVVKLEAFILALRDVAAGETVGYNSTWTAKRPSRLATIGVGYADGYPRSASNMDAHEGAHAMVGGVRCKLAGRVSMDTIVLDVTDAPKSDCVAGAPVTLLGDGVTIDDLAGFAGTNGYEILTRLGARYARVHLV